MHTIGKPELRNIPYGRGRDKKNKVRNEEARAAGLQNVLNKCDHHSSKLLVPVRPAQDWKFTDCMPSGRFIWATSPARKNTEREEEGGSEEGKEGDSEE